MVRDSKSPVNNNIEKVLMVALVLVVVAWFTLVILL